MQKIKDFFARAMAKIKDIMAHIGAVNAGVWIRLILMLISIINLILTACGVKTIPFTTDEISEAVAAILVAVNFINSYWKNNSFTGAAQAADRYLRKMQGKQ